MNSATTAIDGNRKRLPSWLVYSLLTILLWGVWGALTKAISADIDACMNQLLFGLGVLRVMVIVLFLRDWREGRTVGAESSMRL
jgi:hypothetical protein